MEENIFNDKSLVPDGRTVQKALGEVWSFWLELRKHIQENYGPAIEEWKYYGPKSGWTMKMFCQKKDIFSFVVIEGGFRISFVFGDKTVDAIRRSELPKSVIDEIASAQKYPEGRGFSIEVKDRRFAAVIRTLIKIKSEN